VEVIFTISDGRQFLVASLNLVSQTLFGIVLLSKEYSKMLASISVNHFPSPYLNGLVTIFNNLTVTCHTFPECTITVCWSNDTCINRIFQTMTQRNIVRQETIFALYIDGKNYKTKHFLIFCKFIVICNNEKEKIILNTLFLLSIIPCFISHLVLQS
jgi:hypothetical protein